MKKNFINEIKLGAMEGYRKYKILPSLTMAQAILESGWGKSHIENNLFGIKVGSNWKGKVAIKGTKEFANGQWITIKAEFRAYNNFNESIEDHAKLLGENKRYIKVVQAKDYKIACTEIYKAGYATDPDYPKKLITIIEQNNLDRFDKDVVGVSEVLRLGSRGSNVKILQSKLNALELNVGATDGIFGVGTEKAVKELQDIFGLDVDGIVGKNTLDLLDKLEEVKHFKLDEFRCKHCGKLKLDINLLLKLEELRELTGPLVINSGYRCPIHNKNVGGASNSQHIRGTAADVKGTKTPPATVYIHANIVFKDSGVGRYNTFTHVDVRSGRSRWNG